MRKVSLCKESVYYHFGTVYLRVSKHCTSDMCHSFIPSLFFFNLDVYFRPSCPRKFKCPSYTRTEETPVMIMTLMISCILVCHAHCGPPPFTEMTEIDVSETTSSRWMLFLSLATSEELLGYAEDAARAPRCPFP